MSWIADAVIAGIQLGVGAYQNNKKNQSRVNTSWNNYQSRLDAANRSLEDAERYYNDTRNRLSSKYGSNVFSAIEAQYNKVNNINQYAVTRNNLDRNTVVDNEMTTVNSTNTRKEFKDKINNNKFETTALDLSNYETGGNHSLNVNEFGSYEDDNNFGGQLLNLLKGEHTALAQELKLDATQINNMLNQAFEDTTRRIGLSSLQSQAYSQSYRAQNLTDQQSIAQAQASQVNTGFRNTGAMSANEHLAVLQADMNDAAYALQLKQYSTQLRAELENLQTSSSVSAYERSEALRIKEMTAIENVVSAYVSDANKAETGVRDAKDRNEEAQMYLEDSKEAANAAWYDRWTGVE